jgi:hypothetical protein
MTDLTRYALVDAAGHVLNTTNIGLIFERVPKIEADGVTVTFTDMQVPTTVLPVTDMIVPGDKYIDGKFVKATDNTTHHAVIRNRDGVILHFVDFPSEVVQIVPDPNGVAGPGDTWDGNEFKSSPPAETPQG